jgi:phage terminase large subunit GpA-like protein
MNDAKSIVTPDIPLGPLVLTCGIDVNERTTHFEVVGWGLGFESWGIEYGVIIGNPREACVWQQLDRLVYSRKFICGDGAQMRVRMIAIDSGYATDPVYRYAEKRRGRVIAVKGRSFGVGLPFLCSNVKYAKGIVRALVQDLNVDRGKEDVVYRFNEIKEVGPGYCHYPISEDGQPMAGYDREYFTELEAEELIDTSKGGNHTLAWKKQSSRRNEGLDVRTYAYAALLISRVNLETMKRDIVAGNASQETPPQKFGARLMGGVKELGISVLSAPLETNMDPRGGTYWPKKSGPFGAVNRPLQP